MIGSSYLASQLPEVSSNPGSSEGLTHRLHTNDRRTDTDDYDTSLTIQKKYDPISVFDGKENQNFGGKEPNGEEKEAENA